MGPVWVQWIFSVACLAVGGYLATLSITRRGVLRDGLRAPDAEYELSHLGMALGMAAMFAPGDDPVPPPVWVVVFGLSAAWFASRALGADLRAGTAWHHEAIGYHLVANLAMLFMLISPHHHHETAGTPGGQGRAVHDGHTSAAGGGWLEGPLGTVLTVVLAGYFALHVMRSVLLLVVGSTRSGSPHGEPDRCWVNE